MTSELPWVMKTLPKSVCFSSLFNVVKRKLKVTHLVHICSLHIYFYWVIFGDVFISENLDTETIVYLKFSHAKRRQI
jgi:hypothetical protein